MAVRKLTCALNGGDATTPNNDLFYRAYGSADSYTNPIHTSGTHVTDGDVTVTGDSVEIDNVDVGTELSFKIAAVDAVGNEGELSDPFVVSDYLLDMYTGAEGAYSLRKLKATALYACRLIRSNDSAETDVILEASGSINLSSLVTSGGTLGTWVGGNNAHVKLWYDQSGNANDALHNTIGSYGGPRLINAGVIELSGGLPTLNAEGVTRRQLISTRLLTVNTWACYMVCELTTMSPASQFLAGQHSGAADAGRLTIWNAQSAGGIKQRTFFNNGVSHAVDYSIDSTVGRHIGVTEAYGDDYYLQEDGGAYEEAVSGESLTPLNFGMNLFAQGTVAGNPWYGNAQEMIFWNIDKSADKDAIRSNLNAFYSVY